MDRDYAVFISHAGPDKETLAIPLYERLREQNIHAFLDCEQLHPGDNGPRVMEYAMKTAPVGIFILSPEFPVRNWTMSELMCFQEREQEAIATGRPVPKLIPVFYRLGVRDCRDTNLFYKKNDRGESVLFENGLLDRVLRGQMTMQQVLEAMKLLSLRTGIENTADVTNDDSLLMQEKRAALLDRIVNAVVRELPKTQHSTENEDPAVRYWRHAEHQKVVVGNGQPSNMHGPSRPDLFVSHFEVWNNPKSVCLLMDGDITKDDKTASEAKMKQTLLESDVDGDVVVIQGMPGVGKTCILRALCHDRDVRNRFSDGVYVISLGSDATSQSFVADLMKAVMSSGGRSEAGDAAKIGTVEAAVQAARNWFKGHTCLFLVDNLWSTTKFGCNVLGWLSDIAIAGKQSAIVVSTREKELLMHKAVSQRVQLPTHEPRSETSRRILIHSASNDPHLVLKDTSNAMLYQILDICGGLPLALSVIGRSIGRISLDMEQDIDRAIRAYLYLREDCGESIIDRDADDYGSLSFALSASLRILQQECHGSTASANSRYSFGEMHRSLCIVQKQQWVPLSMLCRLWNLPSINEASLVAGKMSEVGLLDVTFKRFGEVDMKGVKLHDLVHDFATKECGSARERESWHYRLLLNYNIPADACSAGHGDCRAWWVTDNTADKYIQENIIRHLVEASEYQEALVLVGRPLWIIRQLQTCGILSLERDFDILKCHVPPSNTSPFITKEIKQDLNLLLNTIRMSFLAVKDNPREIFFQLCARLISAKESSSFLRNVCDYASTNSIKPSVRPVTPILEKAEDLQGRLFHCKQATCVALVEEEGLIIAGTKRGQIQVFDLGTSELKKGWQAHGGQVSGLAVTRDRRLIASNSADEKTIRVFNRTNDYEEVSVCRFANQVWSFVLTPDSKRLVVGDNRLVTLWDIESGQCLSRCVTWHRELVSCVAISHDGKRIAVGALGGHVRVAELNLDETPLQEHFDYDSWFLQRFQKGVRSLTQMVAYVTDSSAPDVTDPMPTGFVNLDSLMAKVDRICFTPDGNHVLTASRKGIELLKIGTTTEVDDLTLESGASIPVKVGISTSAVALFPAYSQTLELLVSVREGRQVFLTADKGGQARIFEGDGSLVTELKCGESGENVEFVAFTQQGEKLVWGQPNGIRMIDVASASTAQSLVCKHEGAVTAMCITPNGDRFVTGGEDRTVTMWDCKTGMQVGRAMKGHKHFVSNVEVTPDGRKIVSADMDGTVIVWDLHSQQKLPVFEGHTGIIEMMKVTFDGKHAITGADDETVRIWDLERCDGRHTVLYDHNSDVRRLYLPQNEDQFLSMSHTEGILWNLSRREKVKVVQLDGICYLKEKEIERIFDIILVRTNTNIRECRKGDATIERSPNWDRLIWKQGNEELVMATMDVMAYRISFSPSNDTLCVGLNTGRVSMLRLEQEREKGAEIVE